MKLTNIIVASAIIAMQQPVFAQTSEEVQLSLPECVEIALSANPTVKVADMEITRADYSKKENLASLFPTIDFTGAYQRAIELQTINMNLGGQSQKIKMGSENTWNFGFSASMPLIAPQLWQSLKLSDTQILLYNEQARASRIDMVQAVNKAYFTLLLTKASREVIKQNYDVAVENARVYKERYRIGTASEYDTLRSAVQVTNIEPELLQADIAIKQAQLQLKVLLNLPAEIIPQPTATLEQLHQTAALKINATVPTLAENSSLRSLDIQTEQLRRSLSLKKLAFIPTLAASFSYSWTSINNGNAFKGLQFNPYSVAGLALSVPIFSGGSRYYGVKGAEVQLKEASLQRENLVNNLNMQLQLALDNIKRQGKQISASLQGVKQARKAYEIMQESFNLGAASYLDLRDSELANTTSQLSYFQAIYNYLVAVSDLDYLTGKTNFEQ